MVGPSLQDLAVIFDLDGLLADTEPMWSASARTLLEREGRVYDPSQKSVYMGRAPMEVARLMVEHYDLPHAPEVLMRRRLEILEGLYADAPLEALPGARALVGALERAGVAMAVASGSPGALVELVLGRLGLGEVMTTWLGSDSVDRGKPAPDLFLLAARRLGAEPGRCVVLEDAAAGVEAALAAGMACVAVPLPETPRQKVAAATRVVGSLEELTPADLLELIPR